MDYSLYEEETTSAYFYSGYLYPREEVEDTKVKSFLIRDCVKDQCIPRFLFDAFRQLRLRSVDNKEWPMLQAAPIKRSTQFALFKGLCLTKEHMPLENIWSLILCYLSRAKHSLFMTQLNASKLRAVLQMGFSVLYKEEDIWERLFELLKKLHLDCLVSLSHILYETNRLFVRLEASEEMRDRMLDMLSVALVGLYDKQMDIEEDDAEEEDADQEEEDEGESEEHVLMTECMRAVLHVLMTNLHTLDEYTRNICKTHTDSIRAKRLNKMIKRAARHEASLAKKNDAFRAKVEKTAPARLSSRLAPKLEEQKQERLDLARRLRENRQQNMDWVNKVQNRQFSPATQRSPSPVLIKKQLSTARFKVPNKRRRSYQTPTAKLRVKKARHAEQLTEVKLEAAENEQPIIMLID